MNRTSQNVAAAISADAGMVTTHAHTIRRATPHRTAESRWVAPTPTMAPVMVCVVLTGIPASAVENSVIAPAASAQNPPTSQKQLDIAAARAQRKATVGANMNLSADEAARFWPVYDAYEAKMDKIEDRHVKELKEFAAKYNNFTDADAKKKLDEVIAIQQARLDVQKEFIAQFRAVVSQVKVTRFYQIDNKIQALIQCDIAQLVPMAQSPGEVAR